MINILEFLKNGSGIHIKPENKGKFTKYCHGKVTDECIRKAKASGNPTLVKRATFAANARKWKHKDGGILKGQYGLITNVDRRKDTTGKGIGSIPFFGAAKFGSSDSPLALFYGSKEGGPQPGAKFGLQTGAPTIIPGRMNKGVEIIEKEAPNLFELINKFPSVAKDIVTKNIRKWKEFFRTGDKNILKSFESNAESVLNARNIDNVTYGKGFIKGNEVAPTSGTQSISETGLSVRDTKLGNMNNPPANPAEKLAVQDWNKINPENQINAQLPTGRPSYELKLEGFDPIDIRYPKQAQPLQKKLNSVQRIEQKAPKKTAKERYQERKETPSRNERKKDSYNQTYEDGDIRHTNSGNRRVGINQDNTDWEALGKYSTFAKRHHNIELRLSKHTKGTPAYKQAWKERKALIQEYREKFRFRLKKGGKAFVEGVNILDSNPKMSKTASRRVKKADDGTKLNAFQEVGKFLNSDTGKTIGNTLMNGLSAGFQAKQMNDTINEYELASKAKLKKIMNGISTKDYYDQVLQQMNPNENLSQVVLNTRAYALAQQDAQKKVNEAKDESALRLNKIKQFASEQNQDNFSNVFGGIAQLGSLLNNKPASKVDNGTPSNSYFDNYTNNYFKNFGTFNSDGSMNMLSGTFTVKDGYKPNHQQLFNYEVPKLNAPNLKL